MCCGCSVVLSVFMLLSLNSHFNSDRPKLGGHELYCTCMTEGLFHLVYHQYSLTCTWTGSHSSSVGHDFPHGHISEEGAEGTHKRCLCSWLWWNLHCLRICWQDHQGMCGRRERKRRVEREEGEKTKEEGNKRAPLSSCLNFLIIKLTPYTAQKIPISL